MADAVGGVVKKAARHAFVLTMTNTDTPLLFKINPVAAGLHARDHKRTKKPDTRSKDKILDKVDEGCSKSSEDAAKMGQAINMFAGAVATFSNAIDEKQAWAAWAGEVGRAGLRQSVDKEGNVQPGYVAPKTSSTPYDALYDKYSKQSGVPVEILKNISRVESQFNPKALGPMTKYGQAHGLMQVLQSNAPGVDLSDPENNIREGANVYNGF